MGCAAGVAPPIWKAYVSDCTDAEIVGGAVTVKVTGIICPLLDACAEVREIVPLYTPAVRFAGLTATVREAGVVAAVEVTESPLPPEATPVNGRPAPPLAVMLVIWLAGLAPFKM